MKPGELVEIMNISRWGGISHSNRHALVLSSAYTGYDRESSRWNVLMDNGEILVMMEKKLRRINESR